MIAGLNHAIPPNVIATLPLQ